MATQPPVLAPGQNQFGERDPRLVDQGTAPENYKNDALVDLAEDAHSYSGRLPTVHEISETGATLEQILTQLWSESYKERIEPSNPTALAQMSPKRKEMVEKWRAIWFKHPLQHWRQAPDARSNAIIYLQDAWKDERAIQQG